MKIPFLIQFIQTMKKINSAKIDINSLNNLNLQTVNKKISTCQNFESNSTRTHFLKQY